MKSYDSHHFLMVKPPWGDPERIQETKRAENSPFFSSRNGIHKWKNPFKNGGLTIKKWWFNGISWGWLSSINGKIKEYLSGYHLSSHLQLIHSKLGDSHGFSQQNKPPFIDSSGIVSPVAKCLRLPEDHPSNWRITPFTRYTCPLLRYLSESYGKLIKIKNNVHRS